MRAVLALLVSLFVLAGEGPARGADLATAPGTRVALAVPPGFAPATNASGFANKSAGASILVSELSAGAYAELRAKADDPAFWSSQGLTLVDTGAVPGMAYEHVLVQGLRTQADRRYQAWVVIFKHPELTGMVAVQLQQQPQAAMSPAAVKSMLATIRVVAAPAVEPISALPFTIEIPARFTYRQASGGRQLVLKETPPPPKGLPTDVQVSIAPTSQGGVRAYERDSIFRQTAYALSAIRVETIAEPVLSTMGGMAAMEATGDGRSPSGEPRQLYMAMYFGAKQTYTLFAVADPDRMRFALDDLKKLARSFKLK